MLIPSSFQLFTKLIPIALIISGLALLPFGGADLSIHSIVKRKKSILVFLFICLFSFIIEVLGANTGLIFGNYFYGNSLSFKLFHTPLIIGLNWLILVYTTSSVLERLKIHNILKIALASSLMLLYDIILEKVAPILDMWHFKDGVVPLQNYLSWFAVSIMLHSLIKQFRINTENKLSAILLICQFLFFFVLATFLK